VQLLLDTHTFLWWMFTDRKLPARVRRRIADPHTTVFVSAVSAWEISTKWRIGKLNEAEAIARDVGGAIASQGFTPLPVSVAHAEHGGRLAIDHRDPFDRMLIAQARLEGIPVASSDEIFDDFGIERLW
jgi:PIN domain nuclease of toxin-antitoxin system